MSYSNGPKIVTNGLVLYLDAGNTKSYPGSGTSWFDLSSNNNHGTLINGPIYNSTNKGVMVFDGINDYCSVAHNNILNLTETFTISIWISPANNTDKYILGKNNAYAIIIGYQTGNVNFFNLSYQPTASSTQIQINNNEFTYICYTKDLNTLSNNWKGYKNNNNIFTLTRSFTNTTNSSDLTIGSANASVAYSQTNIAQVCLYNRALTTSEVSQNYNATKGRYRL